MIIIFGPFNIFSLTLKEVIFDFVSDFSNIEQVNFSFHSKYIYAFAPIGFGFSPSNQVILLYPHDFLTSHLEPGDVLLEEVVRHAAQVLADRLLGPHCNPHL